MIFLQVEHRFKKKLGETTNERGLVISHCPRESRILVDPWLVKLEN